MSLPEIKMIKMNNSAYRIRWERLCSQAQVFWTGLALREKRLLVACALVLVGLLSWQLLIQPPMKKIDYWQAETPKLRAQAEALQALLLGSSAGLRVSAGQELEAALHQNLDNVGLKGRFQLQATENLAPGSWQVTFKNAPADAVVDWLLSSTQAFSLEVSQARLQRAGTATAKDSVGTLSGTVHMIRAPGAKEAS